MVDILRSLPFSYVSLVHRELSRHCPSLLPFSYVSAVHRELGRHLEKIASPQVLMISFTIVPRENARNYLQGLETNKAIAHAYVVLIECYSKNKIPVFIIH